MQGEGVSPPKPSWADPAAGGYGSALAGPPSAAAKGPNQTGSPRAERPNPSSSASVCGTLTYSTQSAGRANGQDCPRLLVLGPAATADRSPQHAPDQDIETAKIIHEAAVEPQLAQRRLYGCKMEHGILGANASGGPCCKSTRQTSRVQREKPDGSTGILRRLGGAWNPALVKRRATQRQSVTFRPGTRWKCMRLLVTMVASKPRACAAMSKSMAPIVCPASSNSWRTWP